MSEPDYESLPPSAGIPAHLAAGALAGIAEHTVMYPLDLIKTRMQNVTPNPRALYSSVRHAFTQITTTEGPAAMWRGVSAVLLGAGPAHALYFSIYEIVKASLLDPSISSSGIKMQNIKNCDDRIKKLHGIQQPQISPTLSLSNVDLTNDGGDCGFASQRRRLTAPYAAAIAAGVACLVHDALMNPFDVMKQRMQQHGSYSTYRSLLHCAQTVARREGFRAFYSSYPATIATSIPFQTIHFAAYEKLSILLNPNRIYNPSAHLIAGAAAGATAAALTTPLDAIKTILQTHGDSTDPAVRMVRGIRDAITLLYSRHGIYGFTRGLVPRVLINMPSTAVSWVTYEYFKKILSFVKNIDNDDNDSFNHNGSKPTVPIQ